MTLTEKMAKRKTKIKTGTTDYKRMSYRRKEEHRRDWEGGLGRQSRRRGLVARQPT